MSFGNLRFLRYMSVAAVVIIADYLLVLTDCVIAGKVLGESALGAMNLMMPVFSVVAFFIWMLAAGTASLYSGDLLKSDSDRAAKTAGQGLLLSVLLGFALGWGMLSLMGPYLSFMAPDATLSSLSVSYCRWYSTGILVQAVNLMLFYLVYASGCERVCINAYCLQVVVNIGASYWLAGRMGISGLSVGSVLSHLVGVVMLAGWLRFRGRGVSFCFGFDLSRFLYAIKPQITESLVWLFHAGLCLAITKYVLYFWDSESLAVCAVVFCIIRLVTFFGGVGIALRPLEMTRRNGTPADAEAMTRVFRIGSTAAFALMCVVAAVVYIAPEPVIGLFGIETGELVVGAKRAARITVIGLLSGGLISFVPILFRVRKARLPEAPLNYLQGYVFTRIAADPASQMFNLAKLFRVRKGVDLERLSAALVASAYSHTAIHSIMHRSPSGEIVQRKELKQQYFRCPVVKADEKELLANRSSLVKSFNVFGGCLFDARIFDCGENAYLLSNFHHLICDGFSFPLILEDAHKVWNGETLTPDPYYEVLARREEKSATPIAVAGRTFMRELLKSKQFTSLPKDDFRGESGYGYCEVSLTLPADFKEFLALHRVTRHHVFLAATVHALHVLTGSPDMLVDWVFHGRVSKDELRTVGAFMVDLPLIMEGMGELTAPDIIAQVKRSTFNGIKNVNIFKSVEDCNPTGQDRLTFIYQDEWGELMSPGPVRSDGPYAWMIEETIPLAAPSAATENPFNVEIMEHHDGTRLFVEYDTGRYSEATVHRYTELFRESLNWLLGK